MIHSLFRRFAPQPQPRGPAKGPGRLGEAIKYLHLPEFGEKFRRLGRKFGHFAFMLAMIFRSARLLPANHPMINPINIGRFGITDVIATAANRLVMKRQNMDQVLVFGAVMLAMIMVIVQAVLIGLYAFVDSAKAADAGSIFGTPNPDTDLAFQFLRHVFGVQGIFGSGTVVEQTGLHAILGFYSTAMMVVAVMIVVYYVAVVVGESAQSGTPFGRRFNGLWAPIRLVLALGLLVPLGGGLNAAQYLTLYMAKFGSGLATQGWILYTEKFIPESVSLGVGAPPIGDIGISIFQSEACRAIYNTVNANISDNQKVKVLVVPSGASSGRNSGARSWPATFTGSDITRVRPGTTSITYNWTVDSPGVPVGNTTCGSITMSIVSKTPPNGDPVTEMANQMLLNMQTAYIEAMGTMVRGFSGSTTTQNPDSPAMKIARLRTGAVSSTGGPALSGPSEQIETQVAEAAGRVIIDAQNQINNIIGSMQVGNSSLLTQLTGK